MIMNKKKTVVKTPNTVNISNGTPKTPPAPLQTPQKVIRDSYLTHDGDSMRHLFFIVKGQYRKGVEPSFVNSASGDVSYIGGYDPNSDNTENWYMLMDKITFHCVSCGSDFNKVLHGVYTQIMKHKGSAKKYFRYVSDTTSDDYYETHYLGHPPLSHDQRTKKAEGRCPRVSPPMRCLYNAIYNEYGDHYCDLISDMEDQAYSDLEEVIKESRPINKTRKLMKRTLTQKVEMETPKTLKGVGGKVKKINKTKIGVKKLKMA